MPPPSPPLPVQTLDVNVPGHVDPHTTKWLEVHPGVPQIRMLIFTGIAIPRWDSRGLLDKETVLVKLGVFANKIAAYSATIGLASINNTGSQFTFGTDSVEVELDENQQLQLRCTIAVQGDSSTLNSFSYQANVLLEEAAPTLLSLELTRVEPELGSQQYTSSLVLPVGASWKGRVTLSVPAPGVGLFVLLGSDRNFAGVPPAVPVVGGSTIGEFFATKVIDPPASKSIEASTATITATLGTVIRTATIRVVMSL